MRAVRLTLALTAFLFVQQGSHAAGLDYESSWACDRAKFSWYCDQEEEALRQEREASRPAQTEEEKALAEIERIKKDLEAKWALAIVSPTPENLRSFLLANEAMMGKASTVSDVWRRVVWQSPDLNYELKRPANNAAIASYNAERKAVERRTLEEINKEWGVFFFFRSDCPYCHRLAPTLKFLSEEYGLTVFPISGDGIGLKEYPRPARDNGLAERLGVKAVPMLVLGNIKTRQMIPLASGLVSAQDVIERIYVLTSTQPGELY